MRFLVVEDNVRLGAQILQALEEQGYQGAVTASGREGEELATAGGFDGIVLDVMLPDHDGMQICKNLRRQKINTPVLMLTSLASTGDKVAGLEAGADDYLCKPFELDEFIARVRALLRRAQPDESTVLRFEGVEMDLVRRSVKRDERPLSLTTKEFALLEHFLRNPNRIMSRSVIGERVWNMAFEEESNVIEVYVSRLRNKLERGFDRPLIHTVVGAGYVLSAHGPPV